MPTVEQIIRIEVTTKDGQVHNHDFPATDEKRRQATEIMAQALTAIALEDGSITLGNPLDAGSPITTYAAGEIARIRDYEIPNN